MRKLNWDSKLKQALIRDKANCNEEHNNISRDDNITFICNCGNSHTSDVRRICQTTGAFCITCTKKRASLIWWFEAANPNQRQWLNELMEVPFETMYPEYDLSIDYRGNTLDQQLRVALLSGTGPDIIQTPGPGYLATMVKAGQLMPLDKYADEFGWRDRILDVFLNMGS